jgi:hypothetical protein
MSLSSDILTFFSRDYKFIHKTELYKAIFHQVNVTLSESDFSNQCMVFYGYDPSGIFIGPSSSKSASANLVTDDTALLLRQLRKSKIPEDKDVQ